MRTFKLSAIASLLLISYAQAETLQSENLQQIEVAEASNDSVTEKSKSLTTSAMSTTTGLQLSPKETPQSVSVITKAQLDNQGITNIADALKTTTGINVVKEGGTYRFQSRGFYIDQIEENGISSTVRGSAANPYTQPQSSTDLAVYDHIEVVRGATGLTQVNGQPGGTINMVFKKPTAETQIQGDITLDRFGKIRNVTDISGSLNESKSVRGRLVTALERDPTFRDTFNSLGLIYGTVEADVGEYSRLTLGLLHQRQRTTPDPAGLVMGTDGSDLGLARDSKLFADWNRDLRTKTQLFTEFEHYLNNKWKWTTKLAYIKYHSEEKFATLARRNSGDASDTTRIGIISQYDREGYELAGKMNLAGTYSLFGWEHDAFITYAYSKEHSNMSQINAKRNANATFNVYNFNGTGLNPDWNDISWKSTADTLFVTHSVYGGSRFNLWERLHLLIAGNFSYFKSHYVEPGYNYLDNKAYLEDTLTYEKKFTPYYGLTFDLNENNALYASYTSIFKPSYGRKDKDGKQVDPKVGRNLELGWKGSWYNDALNASFALFQIDEKNRPISITKAMDPTAERNYTATIGRVRSRGWEVELAGKLTDNWQISTGYTYNYSQYMTNESTRLPAGTNYSRHTPKHMFRLYTSYRLPFDEGKWTISTGISAQSETASSNNQIRQGGFTLWNANLQYDLNKNITLHLIGTNLTNKRYYQNSRVRNNLAGNYYGEPLNIAFKLDWRF